MSRMNREITKHEAFWVWLACMAGMVLIIGWCFLATKWGLW